MQRFEEFSQLLSRLVVLAAIQLDYHAQRVEVGIRTITQPFSKTRSFGRLYSPTASRILAAKENGLKGADAPWNQ
jgi:hypothetical protein